MVNCGNWEGRGESLQDANGGGTGVGADGKRKSLEKTLGLDSKEGPSITNAASGLPSDLNWVKSSLTDSYSPMAPFGAMAQVHLYLFTTSMMDLAKKRGVKYVSGKVTEININDPRGSSPYVTGVTYTPSDAASGPQTLPATHVILAAGAWSPRIIPSLPIAGTRAHSVTIVPMAGTTIAPYVLFTEISLPPSLASESATASPEIYTHLTNEVYCCSPGDDSPVPETVDEVEVDIRACESIREYLVSISAELREGMVDRRQACFLSVMSVGEGPMVGAADSVAKGLDYCDGTHVLVHASFRLVCWIWREFATHLGGQKQFRNS